MSTSTVPGDVQAYLRRVREHLSDLPAEEREDLLADVEPSVLESTGDSTAPVELRLGPPERFADELRTAAGLPPRPGAPGPALRERLERWAANPRLRAAAPTWWVAAACVAVAFAVASAGGGDDWADLAMGLAAVAVAVAALATVLGRRWRWLTVALAVALLPVIAGVSSRAPIVVEVAPVVPDSGLSYDGLPLDNVFAFDRRGRLLFDVRLYAGNGEELDIGRDSPDASRRLPVTRDGQPAYNAFPVRYFEPGTRRVARPRAGAPPAPAALVTPPPGG